MNDLLIGLGLPRNRGFCGAIGVSEGAVAVIGLADLHVVSVWLEA